MKVVLLITLMFTLALVHGENSRPCLPSGNNNAYNKFVRSHILHQDFNRGSKQAWRTYLQQNCLCHKHSQTFMERKNQRDVKRICQGYGWRFKSYSNSCISNSPIMVHELTVDNNCQIQKLANSPRYVVVACDVIDNVCLPVHFKVATKRGPNKKLGHCRKRRSVSVIST